MNNFRDYLASLMEVAKLTIHSQRAEIAELMQKTQQLERKNVELRFLADGHEETIERLERENAVLRSLLREAITEHVDPYQLPEGDHYIARVKAALREAKP